MATLPSPTPPPTVPPRMRPRLPVLPMAAVGLGLLAIVVQLVLTSRTPLPDVGPSRVRVMTREVAVVRPIVADPLIGAKTLFSPSREYDPLKIAAANAPPPPPDPFDGVTLVGVARSRRVAIAVVKRATGELVQLHLGERIGDWRLAAVLADGARFGRHGKAYPLRVGEAVHLAAAKAGGPATPGVVAMPGAMTPAGMTVGGVPPS